MIRAAALIVASIAGAHTAGALTHVPAGTLADPAPHSGDRFGAAVALVAGNVLAGDPMDDLGNATNTGAAHLFARGAAPGSAPLCTFRHPSAQAEARFGASVAAAGTVCAVSAPSALLSSGFPLVGRVFLFDCDPASQTFCASLGELTNPHPVSNDRFGEALTTVGTDAKLCAVAAHFRDDDGASALHLFDCDRSSATFRGLLKSLPAPAARGSFAGTVARAGALCMVRGDAGDDLGSLATYLFDCERSSPSFGALRRRIDTPIPFAPLVGSAGKTCLIARSHAAQAALAIDCDPASPSFGRTRAALRTEPAGIRWVGELGDGRCGVLRSPQQLERFDCDPESPSFGALVETIAMPAPIAVTSIEVFAPRVAADAAGLVVGGDEASAVFLFAAAACGDGIIGTGEECDDGNALSGDCCSATCRLEDAGNSCDDGHPCTVDACDGAGTCAGAPDPARCDDRFFASDPRPGDLFGTAVALVGENLLVGAPGQDHGGFADTGSAYLFAADPAAAPLCVFRDPLPGYQDGFGTSVSKVGSLCAIGEPLEDRTGIDEGAVHLFDCDPTSPRFCSFVKTLRNPNPPAEGFLGVYGHSFGRSVAGVGPGGRTCAVGTTGDGGLEPIVHLFDCDPGSPALGQHLGSLASPVGGMLQFGRQVLPAGPGGDQCLVSEYDRLIAHLFSCDPTRADFGQHLLTLPRDALPAPLETHFGFEGISTVGSDCIVAGRVGAYRFDCDRSSPGWGDLQGRVTAEGLAPWIGGPGSACFRFLNNFTPARTVERFDCNPGSATFGALQESYRDPEGVYAHGFGDEMVAGTDRLYVAAAGYLPSQSVIPGRVYVFPLGTFNSGDGNPCTDDVCTPAGCTYAPVAGRPCDDGLFCTVGDRCTAAGTCGAPRDCAAAAGDDPCYARSCDEARDICVAVPISAECASPTCTDDGLACDDADACTDADTCQSGTCGGQRRCRVDVARELVVAGPASLSITIEGPARAKVDATLLDASGNGAPLAKRRRAKIRRSGGVVLRLKPARAAKKRLRSTGRIDAVVQVRITERGGGPRLVRQDVALVLGAGGVR